MARQAMMGVLLLVLTGAEAAAQTAQQEERPLVFGVNRVAGPGYLYNPPDYDEHVYQRVREAGGTCVRLAASPRDIERVRGRRDWREFDRDLELALKYEQEPIVVIVNTPAWASPSGEDTHLYPYKTDLLGEFGDFCAELARRTRGKAKYFQLWNEQNGCSWHFHDGFNHADEYLPVLKVCYEALKKANPDCILSLGSLDDAEGHAPIFMRRTYEEMTKQSVKPPVFEVVSDHPYSENSSIMRGKLDTLRQIMRANGNGDMPFWITEYGWQIGDRDPRGQAARLAEVLKAFIQPEWKDLQAAVYLSIGDFEGGTGFGICDANLRPRAAFYAFQGASRFGAFPAYEIKPVFTAADRLVLTWKTLEPTTGRVSYAPVNAAAKSAHKESPRGTEHRIEIDGLEAEAAYTFTIETSCEQGGPTRKIRSAAYHVRVPGKQVYNGDFESGFFAGIARGWQIEGQDLCTDASLVPFTRVSEGKHAQAVYASGDDNKLDSTLSTVVAAAPGEPIHLSLFWAGKQTVSSGKITARACIDPAGGTDPRRRGIKWTEWREVKLFGEDHTFSATAANSVVRLFVQCRSEGAAGKGPAMFVLDKVRVVPGETSPGE